ncbi:MAG TPA: MFS transporter, partial [Blastocatellia bacterium]|nr:MFS transporter [Blastocatellia bacterium]
SVLVGSLILRVAAQTMGLMVLLYLEYISNNYISISHTETGFIVASFFIAELVGAPVFGALSDRYGRKIFIILGPLLGAIAVQITSLTVVIWILVITRLLEGLSTASSIPATLGYISEMTAGRPKLRARIVGLFEITLVGGMAAGAFVGGQLWKYFGTPRTIAGVEIISPAFALNGLIYLASLAIFAWGLKNIRRKNSSAQARHSNGEVKRFLMILRSPSVWRFVPAWLAIFSIIGLWTNHSPRLLTGQSDGAGQLLMGNVSPDKFGAGFGILAVFFAVGVLVWSFYLSRYRKTSVMLVATGGLFLTLATVYGFNQLGSFSSAFYYPLMGCLLLGLFVLSGFTPAALTYLADVTESYKEDRGSIMGLYSLFLGIGQFVGTTIGGQFADRGGIDGLILLSAIFGIITIFTLLRLRQHESPARISPGS